MDQACECGGWSYTRLPETNQFGRFQERHQYSKDGYQVVFSYNRKNGKEVSVTVNAIEWLLIDLTHPRFRYVHFEGAQPTGLEKLADFVMQRVIEDYAWRDVNPFTQVSNMPSGPGEV